MTGDGFDANQKKGWWLGDCLRIYDITWYNRYNHTLQRGIMTIDFGKCLWLGLPRYSEYVVSSVPHFRVLHCLCKDRHGGTLAPGMNPATESRPRRDHCEWSSRSVLMPWKSTALRDGATKRTMRPQVLVEVRIDVFAKPDRFCEAVKTRSESFFVGYGFWSCLIPTHKFASLPLSSICPNKQTRQDVGRTHTIVTLQHDCNTFEIMCKLIDCPIDIEKTL